MTDEAALIAAVRDRFDDDTPRLVYADWLDDHDRPERAELVRVQCDLDRFPGSHRRLPVAAMEAAGFDGDPEHGAVLRREIARLAGLRTREEALLAAVGCDGVPVGIGSTQVTWRRGFVEACEVSAEAWERHSAALLAAHPVRRVKITTWPGSAHAVNDPLGQPLPVWLIPASWTDGDRGEAVLVPVRRERLVACAERKWEGVTFRMPDPAPAWANWVTPADASPLSDLRAAVARMTQEVGLGLATPAAVFAAAGAAASNSVAMRNAELRQFVGRVLGGRNDNRAGE